MEVLIYVLVKITITVLVLKKLWRFLFRGDSHDMLWSRIPIREVKPEAKVKPKPKSTERKDAVKVEQGKGKQAVVGSTKVVILSDPKAGTAKPVSSQDLEPTGYIGQYDGISPDDFETDFNPYPPDILSPEELYDDQPISDYDPDMLGGGVSFEEINDAVAVLIAGDAVSEERMFKASGTLLELRNTAIIDMITCEISTQSAVDKLIGGFYTDDGVPKKSKVDKVEDIRMKEIDPATNSWW